MSEPLVFEVILSQSYDDALKTVETALKAEGFGILTHVNVRNTFKEKLDVDFRPYSILGACNPSFAHRLLTVEPRTGLVLPCKITVEAAEGNTSIVRFINPEMILKLELGDDPAIPVLAHEVEEIIRRVVGALENLQG